MLSSGLVGFIIRASVLGKSRAGIGLWDMDLEMGGSVTRLHLDGMTCGSCVARAERVLTGLPGVTRAAVNLGTQSAEVEFAEPATREAMAQALGKAGYPVVREHLTLAVEGMTCAACTGRVERVLRAVPGVAGAVANLATRRVEVELWERMDPARLSAVVAKAGYPAQPLAGEVPSEDMAPIWRRVWVAAALTLPVFVAEMGGHLVPAFHHWLYRLVGMQPLWWMQMVLVALVLAGPGRVFFAKGIPALLRGSPDMNALVALGSGAAFIYSALVVLVPQVIPEASRAVYFEAAAVIVVLILLGRALEARARGRAGQAIARLVQLVPKTARVLAEDGSVSEMAVAQLRPGLRVQIRPGERIPTDGVVVEGASAVDQSMLTGEPIPVAKGLGDALTGGTMNGTGGMVMQIAQVGADTVLARIIAMVEAAQGGKLPVQALVDKITLWFVPAVMAVAVLAVVAWLIFGPGLAQALVAGVSVLIIACPCAMGLAVPVSILVGSGRAAEMGVLFRRGEAMQRLEQVSRVAFDKTGTLTEGRPKVVFVRGEGALEIAAAVEAGSEHPLAAAVLEAAQGMTLPVVTGFEAVPGQGARGFIGEEPVAVGSARMFDAVDAVLADQAAAAQAEGKGVLFVARGGRVFGLIAVADPVKPQSQAAVAALRDMGIAAVMVTGDARATAAVVAKGLGIEDVRAGILPEGKAEVIKGLGAGTAFVGDGINDAPALAQADVGIAMGSGSDVAIEAGDVVLMTGDPMGVVNAIGLSRAVMRNIRQNLLWAFGYNVALIPIAAGALVPFGGPQLSPMLGAGAMALSSVFVLSNALRLRRFRRL